MMIWSPRRVRNGARVTEPASLVDVLPTLVEAAGGAIPTGIQGASLWPAAVKGEAPPSRDLLLGLRNLAGDSKAIVRWPHKLIEEADGTLRLYDLSVDPGEQSDLAAARPAEAAALRDAMHAAYAGLPRVAQDQATVGASQVELLHELGYVEPDEDAPAE
jgi:arylsulfatase A-like enzyme